MTIDEAIKFGNVWLEINEDCEDSDTYDFVKMATQTFEQKSKIGYWIPMGLVDANDNRNYECSECHCGDTHAKNQIVPYCWHCGTKMEREAI